MELKSSLKQLENILDRMIQNQTCYEKIVRLTKFAYEVSFLKKMQESLLGHLLYLVDQIKKQPELKNIGYITIKKEIAQKYCTLKRLKFVVPLSAIAIFQNSRPKIRSFRLKKRKNLVR